MVTKTAIDRLPSLPQVLVQILDAIHSDNADYQRIANIIRQDAAIAAKLISISNSSYYNANPTKDQRCDSIERALLFLGTDTVKTIVITAATKQFFSKFSHQHHQFMRSFWRRSLASANFAQVLATLTSYNAPDEAYLCGLLSDVGQLILLCEHDSNYLSLLEENPSDRAIIQAEQQQFTTSHSSLSGELADSWALPGFMADALRYHHESTDQVLDAQHLVKIVNLSNLLSQPSGIDDTVLEAANELFNFNEALTRELGQRISSDIDKIATSLNIDLDDTQAENEHKLAQQALGERLSELSELSQLKTTLWQANGPKALQTTINRSLYLTFGISNSLLFLYDAPQNVLTARDLQANDDNAVFVLPAEAERSCVSDCFIHSNKLQSDSSQKLKVIDRQLLRYCQAETLVALPLVFEDTKLGVLLLGTNQQQIEKLERRDNMAQSLCQQIAAAINASYHRVEEADAADNSQDYELMIREAVHEASNPLSIIRNYLETLRIKLGDEHNANESLSLIKSEIDRVGNILLRLNDPEKNEAPSSTNINAVIKKTTAIFKESMCATKNIDLMLTLDETMPDIDINASHIKQILTNLIKNAAEALTSGQKISVISDAIVSVNGRDYMAIHVEDNGPGISKEIQKQLFSPVTSTKGKENSGLGLSIVKRLVDELDGSIICRTNNSGTQFQVLLPR